MRRTTLGARPDDPFGQKHFRTGHRIPRRLRHQRNVKFAVVHPTPQVAALVDDHVDGDGRMRLGEALQHMRQHALTVVVR